MRIELDGQPLDLDVPADQTLGGVVEQVRQIAAERKRVLFGVQVDGQAVPADRLEALRASPCGPIKQVAFQTACPRALAAEALAAVAATLGDGDRLRREAVEQLNAGAMPKAMEHLAGCLGLFKAAHEAVATAVALNRIDLAGLSVKGQPIPQCLAELTGKLGEVKSALETHDPVLLSDLLIYEFPRAEELWRDVLAELRRQLSAPAN